VKISENKKNCILTKKDFPMKISGMVVGMIKSDVSQV